MFLLDTNILIYYGAGDSRVVEFIQKQLQKPGSLLMATISIVEFLSYSSIPNHDKAFFSSLFQQVSVINLGYDQAVLAAQIRLRYKIELADSVVAATTFIQGATLVSRDKDFKKIKELKVLSL